MNPEVPANDLPLLPPSADLETPSTLKKAISAHAKLAELKGYVARLPNEHILLNAVVLQEARASSEIENIITTQDELYEALVAEYPRVSAETKEVLHYRSAMWRGYELLQSTGLLTTNTICEIQAELEGNDAGIRSVPGTALKNEQTGETVYTPPDNEERIGLLLRNLEEYLNIEEPTDRLIKMAVAHYQFESIHPFYDGNGRTGRILNVLYLVKEGLLDSPILYLSAHIIRHKSGYYRLLQAVRTEQRWIEWVEFMLEAVEQTAGQTLQTVESIVGLMEDMVEIARKRMTKSSYSKELVELLFVQPYVKISHVVEAGLAERRTASKYLRQLEEIGLLESYKLWKEQIFVNRRLVELLKKSS